MDGARHVVGPVRQTEIRCALTASRWPAHAGCSMRFRWATTRASSPRSAAGLKANGTTLRVGSSGIVSPRESGSPHQGSGRCRGGRRGSAVSFGKRRHIQGLATHVAIGASVREWQTPYAVDAISGGI